MPLRRGVASWQAAVGDGEDYELLFTAPVGAMPDEVDGVPITRVGTVTDADGLTIRLPDGSTRNLSAMGWEHCG